MPSDIGIANQTVSAIVIFLVPFLDLRAGKGEGGDHDCRTAVDRGHVGDAGLGDGGEVVGYDDTGIFCKSTVQRSILT